MFSFLERRFEEIIAGVCVLTMTVLVFFQVVMRYVFNMPTSWSDEIAVYAMVWSVYVSASWAVRERAHIRVMNFINLFPALLQLYPVSLYPVFGDKTAKVQLFSSFRIYR